jgi:hypothetical protein
MVGNWPVDRALLVEVLPLFGGVQWVMFFLRAACVAQGVRT